jgi:sulfate adenylyltransferase subunit 2
LFNVQDTIDEGKVVEETGKYSSRNSLQTTTLLDAIEEFKFDACIGGARRDEEKHELKSVFFLFVMILVNGTKKKTSRVI